MFCFKVRFKKIGYHLSFQEGKIGWWRDRMNFSYELSEADIQDQAEALVEFHAQYAPYFRTKTRDSAAQALGYLQGQLLLKGKRNRCFYRLCQGGPNDLD